MKLKIKTKLKMILTLGIMITVPMLFTTVSNADTTTKQEFSSFISRYNQQDLVVENGIVLIDGETLDLSKYPKWELSNNNTVEIDGNGIVTAIDEGTVYLSQEIEDKVYILEIYVSDKKHNYTSRTNAVDRDYYKVFLDPGHGGSDPGALGSLYRESDINLQVAKLVDAKLKDKGIQVQMSRTTDVFLELKERTDLSNAYQPDVFVSIHQNSYSSSSANGIETFYHRDKIGDKPLSDKIQSNLIQETGATNRKVKEAGFGVLRMSINPASLVECGFITNPTEQSKIGNPAYQEKLATAIANGIEQYLKENVVLGSGESQEPLKPVIKTGMVSGTNTLNIRSGYGTSHNVIGQLYSGDKVEIVEESNGWYQILYNGGYGHVSAKYITLDTIMPPSGFVDVPEDHWASSQITDFVDKGYLNGYDDNTFRPNSSISRAEFVKLVNKVFGFTEGTEVKFTDVSKEFWAYDEIAIAVKEGYIDGYPENIFKPNEPITREEAAKVISQIMKLSGDGVLSFDDTDDIADWAKPHIDALSDNGILEGSENMFMPKKHMSRAETVMMLSRINN